METQPPNEAIESLEELAELSLCQENHQNQVDKVVGQWEAVIRDAAKKYETGKRLRKKNRVLEESLNREEEKAAELQDKVEELQARVKKQEKLGELQSEIERLLAEITNEQAKSTSATNRWRKTQLRYEDQKNRTEEYRRALFQSEQQTTKLEVEKADISCQLTAVQEALECAKGKCEELQRTQNTESTREERDNLRAEIAFSESQLGQLNEQSIHMSREVERATTQKMELSLQVENLTTELGLESKTSRRYQSDLIQTLTNSDILLEEVSELRLQLDIERQRSFELFSQLEQAEATNTTHHNDKVTFQSQLDSDHRKYNELTAELSQSKTYQDEISTRTVTLRVELASEQNTSGRLHQELSIIKEYLAASNLVLGETQADLENCKRDNDELKTSAADREKETSTLITVLTDQISFFTNSPFKTFFMCRIDPFKRWANALIESLGWLGSNKNVLGAFDPQADCPA